MPDDLDDTIVRPQHTTFSAYPIYPTDGAAFEDAEADGADTVRTPSGLTDAAITPAAAALAVGTPSGLQSTEPMEFHYRFQVGSNTQPLALDVPWFIGRRPSQPRILSGTSPRLLRVESPAKEVSATHLSLRQLGPSVIATDLMSTNGSVVLVPGSMPRKLLQGDSVVVAPGTVIDIGDGNHIKILGAGS